MNLVFDGDFKNPEIEFSGSAKELVNLGKNLRNFTHDLVVLTKEFRSKYYSESLESIMFKADDNALSCGIDSVNIKIEGKKVYVISSQRNIQNIGVSLVEVFHENSQTNEHFHIDHFEENIQKASLIILCRNFN